MAARILCLLLALLLAPVSWGERLAVIVSADTPVTRLSVKQLQRIYLRKTLIGPDGIPWRPLNLPADHPLRRFFSHRVLRRDPEALAEYWNERYFQGVLPPYVVASETAVLRYVATTPGAIGYLHACHLDDDSVRVVAVFELPSRHAGDCLRP